MVKKNEYTMKNNISKDGVQVSGPANSNSSQKKFQRDGEQHHKEINTRNSRPPRENQARDNNYQKEYQQRDTQRREGTPRDNQQKENAQRDNTPRDNQHNNHQRNYHNTQNRDSFNREQYRQHSQRPVIKPRAEETVEDIAIDIGRIEKEIELELKEIKSMRLGM